MRISNRIFALFIALITLFSSFCVFASADSEGKAIFIDGVNIMRSSDCAVVYIDVPSTKQDRWGHDVIVDKNGKVTKIIPSTDASGNDLAVPEGCMVISSTGEKAKWFKNNVSVGTRLYYDDYTQKLFVCDSNGSFNPYFEKTVKVAGEDEQYMISANGEGSNSAYAYKVAVDGFGIVCARGSDAVLPDGGFIVSAVTDADRQFLIMYALVGAKCVVKDGIATFTYTKDMLKTTVEYTLENAKAKEELIINEHIYHWESLDYCIRHIEEVLDETITYKTATYAAGLLYNTMNDCYSGIEQGSELRGAFHIPTETSEEDVKKTVKAVKEANINTIILKLSNGYNSFIPLPEGNKFNQDEKFDGFDVLNSFIKVGKAENIAIALCIDVYYNEHASVAEPNWLSKTNSEEEGLKNKYFSPASTEFKEYFIDYLKYIVKQYPVEHIMFDYLRYPKFSEGCDLGYDTKTLEAFSKKYKVPMNEAEAIKTELFESKHWKKWVEFKTSLVSDMAKSISETLKTNAPNVSTTVLSARDSVDYYYMQDAYGWIEKGYFDGLCLALYEGDESENDPLDKNAYYDGVVTSKGKIAKAYTGKKSLFFVGIESSCDYDDQILANAIGEARRVGADGFILDSLQGYFDRNYMLINKVINDPAESPFADIEKVASAILTFSENRIALLYGREQCTRAESDSAQKKIKAFLEDLENNANSISKIRAMRDDIAIALATNSAKEDILKDYDKLVKIATVRGITEPEIIEESEDLSEEISDTIFSEIPEESEQSNIENNVANDDNSGSAIGNLLSNIAIDEMLVYGFVSITLIGAVAAIIVGIRRKNAKPKKGHMPKSVRDNENKDDEE